MKSLIIVLLFFSVQMSSQTKESTYFSSGNPGAEFTLEFINDSIVELRSIPRHMSGFFSSRIKYSNSKSQIHIHLKKYIINSDDFKRYGLKNLIDKTVKLSPHGDELIDYKNKIVFINEKNYYRKSNQNKLLSIIDGKKVISKIAKTNGYGLITKRGKVNRDIKKLIRNIRRDSGYYKITRLSGFDAYSSYGIIGLKGVSVYESKNINK